VTRHITLICRELLRRNPDRASAIETLAWRDGRFRSICEDYDEAIRAARHWAAVYQNGANKSAEFNRLAEDLGIEVLQYLDRVERG